MEVRPLLEYLGKSYGSSGLAPPNRMYSSENRVYPLHRLGKGSFGAYKPEMVQEPFSAVAVDGGSVELFDTPYWGIGYIKLRARRIEFSPTKKTGTTVETAARDGFVLFLSEDADFKNDSIVRRKFYEKGNYLKREETRFIRELVKSGKVDGDALLLVDGTLGGQGFYEKELTKLHRDTVGVSKRSGMMINKYAASSYISKMALENGFGKEPWYCYPLVAEYPGGDSVAEMMFSSFSAGSRNCFRVDMPADALGALSGGEAHSFISSQLSKIGVFSLDPKYRDYPYPLGAVHTDAVMRPMDRERAQEFVKREIMSMDIDCDSLELIKKDIESDMWYEKFRRRAL